MLKLACLRRFSVVIGPKTASIGAGFKASWRLPIPPVNCMHNFVFRALSDTDFAALFELDDSQLAARGIERVRADAKPGFPCRVSLCDAEIGDELLLLPFEHQPEASPYRASGPIFVGRGAKQGLFAAGEIPASVSSRMISLRAYDSRHRIVHADVCDGARIGAGIEVAFSNSAVAYLHLHNAKRGCFACRVDRA